MFADDTALVADTEESLQQLVTEFGRVCDRRKLKVNVGKSKVMRCTRRENVGELQVNLGGERLEEVGSFRYSWTQIFLVHPALPMFQTAPLFEAMRSCIISLVRKLPLLDGDMGRVGEGIETKK